MLTRTNTAGPFFGGGLIQLAIVLVVLGLVWYLIETYIPLAAPIKVVIRVVAILILCLWLLRFAGLV
jgi:cobalamin biosynthesis protein CobD/CbiB